MNDNIDNISRLDISKDRLAKAFKNLESLIDKKLSSNITEENDAQYKLLQEKLDNARIEKDKLQINYSDIYNKYASIKLLNLEVVEELNNSIKDIEIILNNHGNNS